MRSISGIARREVPWSGNALLSKNVESNFSILQTSSRERHCDAGSGASGGQRDGDVLLRDQRSHLLRCQGGFRERHQGGPLRQEEPEVLDDQLEEGSQTAFTGEVWVGLYLVL